MNTHALFLYLSVAAAVVLAFMVIPPLALFFRARSHGAPVPLRKLISMRLGSVPAKLIIDAAIAARNSGVSVTIDQLAALHLSGGDIRSAVQAVAAAQMSGAVLTWDEACTIDLAGKFTGESDAFAARTSPTQFPSR